MFRRLKISSYVCGKTVKGYDHFDQSGDGNNCPMTDLGGVEARHRMDVKKAEDAARQRIQAEKPDITAEELKIQLVGPKSSMAVLQRINKTCSPMPSKKTRNAELIDHT